MVEKSRSHNNILYQGQRHKSIFKMSGEVVFKSVDDFEKIPDFAAAYKLMRSWGIPSNGIKDKESAVKKLIERWLAEKEPPPLQDSNLTNMAVRSPLFS